MQELSIEYVPIDSITPYEANAKLHPAEQIAQIKKSIQDYGFRDPVGIWKGEIVEGHGRIIAAKELGLTEVPVIKLDDMTDEQRREYALVHNQTTLNSGFDFSVLDAEIEGLPEFDAAFYGFELPEAVEEKEVVEDEAPEEVETRCKLGDLWQLGNHRLICGDSTDATVIERLMDGQKAQLLLTDPPYNVDVGETERPNSSNDGVHIMNDSMDEQEFIGFLTQALKNASGNMLEGAAYYIWYAGLHHLEFESAIRDVSEFMIHAQLVWVKSHFILGRHSDYQWMHEVCLYGWKTGAPHFFTDSRSETTVIEDRDVKLSTLKKDELIALCEKWMGINKSTTILRAGKPNAADLHPTVKPQGLLCPLIRNSTQQGWSVLDPFGGSGSTLIACEQLNRKCYMSELDSHYCDVIIQRWENFTGEKAVLLNE